MKVFYIININYLLRNIFMMTTTG